MMGRYARLSRRVMRGRVCNTLATSMTLTPAREAKRYLSVFIGFFIAVLSSILALNLALGERALGSVDTLQKASAWQQATHGVTYAPPLTNSRPFKALRLADRLPEINTLVLGASSLMGVTGAMFPAGLRAYNFSLTANATSAVIAEAEYVERHHAGPIRNFVIGLDWAIGMIYQPTDATALDLNPAPHWLWRRGGVPHTQNRGCVVCAKNRCAGQNVKWRFSCKQSAGELPANVFSACGCGIPLRRWRASARF